MKLAFAVAALLLGASSAQAATFAFTYVSTGGTLTGRLTGTLLGDGNTVAIDGVAGPIRFDGVAGPATPVVITASTLYGVERAPTVTFDGAILDFFAITDPDNFEIGVLFDPDIVDFQPLVSTSPEFGNIREPYEAGRWSLAAVPEPATWGLMIAGFGLVGAAQRRRRLAI
ncbi:PEPxxWA-CTERM sorting domain-containing protein [Glacieibacterium frigidum]|uniref:PEP-CTERM sorting domain-containing protein n=1 Tax=Glacieibacterium frigidum TaxID=2593303 RepID=A0A552UGT1_9SPHN|nr:PEPxxWA-CTERM sorting domain-containing protein [Glacieibacterium frigidum]TRW17429.1 PEP-CTERM sorting domain-containing protein [Glacieibacterium frigidum]